MEFEGNIPVNPGKMDSSDDNDGAGTGSGESSGGEFRKSKFAQPLL